MQMPQAEQINLYVIYWSEQISLIEGRQGSKAGNLSKSGIQIHLGQRQNPRTQGVQEKRQEHQGTR